MLNVDMKSNKINRHVNLRPFLLIDSYQSLCGGSSTEDVQKMPQTIITKAASVNKAVLPDPIFTEEEMQEQVDSVPCSGQHSIIVDHLLVS